MKKWLSKSCFATGVRFYRYRRMHEAASAGIRSTWAKIIVAALYLAPAVALIWELGYRNHGSQAGTLAIRQTGDWALDFLILTLAITPLRKFLDLPDLIRFRRTLGLSAFFYGFLHVAAWRVFKLGHALQIGPVTIWSLRIGFLGFVLMIPLAVTSTDRWVRWLGGRRWRALHSLAYLSAAAGLLHCSLLPGTAIWKSVMYCLTGTLLLMARIAKAVMRARVVGRQTLQVGDGNIPLSRRE